MNDHPGLGAWVRATWTGWLLGVPLIVLLALVGEAVGIGGAQVLVGAGMGAGLGLMQARALRGVLPRSAPWFWSWFVGLGLPFLPTDIVRVAGGRIPYALWSSVALGGLIAGAWQAFLLRPRFRAAGWWVVASVAGCGLAAGLVALADRVSRAHALRGIWGALAYLAMVTTGGLVLGLVTGLWLVRLRRRDAAA